ncbi:hypothetical protein PENTCL1PPCAC_21565 [Pristionchus entomophagus]|uniref:Uncharacterized protein n=1 Tax=Pristionchus entomophagus TaxID=358040 RepID=A0AAV5TYQ4_9BILA|nr:hypothetical protein PENTCL1PPCAC_21565 [Pristionchus entomophagus]
MLLEANSCCDHLLLTDGYVGGTIIANLTGEISGKYYYTSISNTMRVSWQPDEGVNVRGLMMSFWTK